jgi:hypothetical protein
MQNKPNFSNTPMNISLVMTKHYEYKTPSDLRQNKPNSNPIKPNFQKAKMNISSVKTKGYANEPRLRTPAKQTQSKANQSQFH